MKKNSQHYRFASFGETQWYDPPDNICPYVRKVLSGLGLFLLWWTFASYMVVWNLYGIALAIEGLWYTGPTAPSFVMANIVTMMLVGGIGVILLWMYCWDKFNNWRDDKEYAKWRASHDENGNPLPAPESSFLGTWYKTIRDKTCQKIEFTD